MLTFEDVTGYFLKAANSLSLATHPEYWMNSRTLEREFACTCHPGNCEEAETCSSCTVSFSWGTLDTALSLEGPSGVCDFFHEPDENCPHLHTAAIPPLVLDLSYTLSLEGAIISEETLLVLMQMLRLRASEHSRRTVETRPGINMVLQDNRLRSDTLTLQQRVELPIWHPDGIRGLLDSQQYEQPGAEEHNDDDLDNNPRPEGWLPQIMVEVCQDIVQVLAALDASISYNPSSNI
ncbi:MAG: hypothetical protein J2P37_22155 [Ktedonobacteraceae bacterium]|nr:hypothetical protein [Ktedonobacteraceae bacterium]MBO0791951.1 hypothetical protein [Ktedonobacteraceae bacterium]